MLRGHPLFADGAADGAGSAVADESVADATTDATVDAPAAKPPVTPIAGGIAPPPKPADGTPAPKGPPPFDWKQAMPQNAPPVFGKYKTLEQASEAHKALQGELEKAKSKKGPALEHKWWTDNVAAYFQNGSLGEDVFQQASQATGLPADVLAGAFEYLKAQRENFIGLADKELGGTLTYLEIEEWLADPANHPFSPEALIGFQELAKRGDTSWLKTVATEYTTRTGAGATDGAPAAPSVPANRKAPARSGRPPNAGSHEGYRTREEYMKAMHESAGNTTARAAVIAKLSKTPEHVRAAWGRPA